MYSRHRGRSSIDSPPSKDPGALPVPPRAPVLLPRDRGQRLGALLEGSNPEQDASFVLVDARHSAVAVPHSIGVRGGIVAAQRAPRQILARLGGCNRGLAIPLPLDHERGGSSPSTGMILPPGDQLLGLGCEFLRSARPRTISGRLAAIRFTRGNAPRTFLRERELFGILAILRGALAVAVFGCRGIVRVLGLLARPVSRRWHASPQPSRPLDTLRPIRTVSRQSVPVLKVHRRFVSLIVVNTLAIHNFQQSLHRDFLHIEPIFLHDYFTRPPDILILMISRLEGRVPSAVRATTRRRFELIPLLLIQGDGFLEDVRCLVNTWETVDVQQASGVDVVLVERGARSVFLGTRCLARSVSLGALTDGDQTASAVVPTIFLDDVHPK